MRLEIGQALPAREFHFTRESLVRYAGASGDFNAIHYRDDVAKAVCLPGVLAHGMLTMEFPASCLTLATFSSLVSSSPATIGLT